MCIKCHSSISNNIISKHLQEALDSDGNDFLIYNSTSISHIIISASGFNGCDIRNKGIKLLNKYNEWLKSNPNYILEESLSPKCLTKIIERINNKKLNQNSNELENYLTNLIKNE